MKLTDDVIKQIENANTKEEVREAVEKAGLELTDDDLDQVTGGMNPEITEKVKKIIDKIKSIFD
ncbi:MAG: hypothetical protein II567_02130 [Candidatus Riflebacteria bacterium]|nr:hypothetical protein [Candidatus Riflebacteria bacterium]